MYSCILWTEAIIFVVLGYTAFPSTDIWNFCMHFSLYSHRGLPWLFLEMKHVVWKVLRDAYIKTDEDFFSLRQNIVLKKYRYCETKYELVQH